MECLLLVLIVCVCLCMCVCLHVHVPCCACGDQRVTLPLVGRAVNPSRYTDSALWVEFQSQLAFRAAFSTFLGLNDPFTGVA